MIFLKDQAKGGLSYPPIAVYCGIIRERKDDED